MGNLASILPGGVSSGGGGVMRWVSLGIAVVAVISSIFKAVYKIETGERGTRTRFGRVMHHRDGQPKEVGPGMWLTIPWTHGIKKGHCRTRNDDLEIIVDGAIQRLIKAGIGWRVMEEEGCVTRALFDIDETTDLVGLVTRNCEDALRRVFMEHPEADQLPNAQILEYMQAHCAERLATYGVALLSVSITTAAKTLGQMLSGGSGASVLRAVAAHEGST